MEIWAVNRHGYEAAPIREGSMKPIGEPFVPLATFNELKADLNHCLLEMGRLACVNTPPHWTEMLHIRADYQRLMDELLKKYGLKKCAT